MERGRFSNVCQRCAACRGPGAGGSRTKRVRASTGPGYAPTRPQNSPDSGAGVSPASQKVFPLSLRRPFNPRHGPRVVPTHSCSGQHSLVVLQPFPDFVLCPPNGVVVGDPNSGVFARPSGVVRGARNGMALGHLSTVTRGDVALHGLLTPLCYALLGRAFRAAL